MFVDWDKIVLVTTLLIVFGGKNKSLGWGKGVGGGVSLINTIWQLWRSGPEVGVGRGGRGGRDTGEMALVDLLLFHSA